MRELEIYVIVEGGGTPLLGDGTGVAHAERAGEIKLIARVERLDRWDGED